MKTTTLVCIFLQDKHDRCVQRIVCNGEVIWRGADLAVDCPEDATLNRSMTNASQVLHLMELAQVLAFNGIKIGSKIVGVSTWDDMEQAEADAIESTKGV